ncbi:DUF4006 family protein [Sulfurimonas autotrophica]|uniref:DUF4006 family protein n=1 Tax=Sulfurimonas autotrophica (strain ATCC BAA-671 / DSM 16294 / JCM 11897 / OK10) TaxID=563040 RepID=E0UR48_SULAO|nr:DUF4006 family protein [Sulfurimonas autotrophica]ADN10004.1 conserved hypothetical protein [Sulfurimonas autotrophica DSM 16294]
MNENRSVFALDGVTGMLIATVLLLSILAFLSVNAVSVQHAQAQNFYKIKDEKSIGSGIGFGSGHTVSTMADHVVDAK